MRWLDRVRQKTFAPDHNGSAKRDKTPEEDLKNSVACNFSSAKSAKSPHGESSVTFDTAGLVGCDVCTEACPPSRVEVFMVAYQRFSIDYDLPDGTYTPSQLRQAKLLVKPGPVLRQTLRWPGGHAEPIGPQWAGRDEEWLFGVP
jgi:hypothetical protein